jgi:hypothetical protein
VRSHDEAWQDDAQEYLDRSLEPLLFWTRHHGHAIGIKYDGDLPEKTQESPVDCEANANVQFDLDVAEDFAIPQLRIVI